MPTKPEQKPKVEVKNQFRKNLTKEELLPIYQKLSIINKRTFTSYVDLCNYLEIEPFGGLLKKNRMEILSSFFNIEKDKQSLVLRRNSNPLSLTILYNSTRGKPRGKKYC